ncbi:Clr5 domain-containing protein [Xylaria sp. FL1042]|nr:Clr5 domain-containing protein [Xylaria sp. FL1042]
MADKRKIPPASHDPSLGQPGNPSKRRLMGFKTYSSMPDVIQRSISKGLNFLQEPTIIAASFKDLQCDESSLSLNSTPTKPPEPTSTPRHDSESEKHWNQYRPLIEDFYKTQSMSLRETMQNMEDDHDFFATARMYKLYLSEWGLLREKKSTKGDEGIWNYNIINQEKP